MPARGRDLKLGNVFLDRHMRIKVGDLGLAASVSSSTERKRTMCGTPNYIAPEILESTTGHSFQVSIWRIIPALRSDLPRNPLHVETHPR